MKRVALTRRHPLVRRTALRSTPKPIVRTPEQAAWACPGAGVCECCGELVAHLEAHHVTPRSLIYRENRGEIAWAPANRMLLCPPCHARHTSHFRLIPVERIPADARAFCVDFFGDEARADDYLHREYGCGRGTGL